MKEVKPSVAKNDKGEKRKPRFISNNEDREREKSPVVNNKLERQRTDNSDRHADKKVTSAT